MAGYLANTDCDGRTFLKARGRLDGGWRRFPGSTNRDGNSWSTDRGSPWRSFCGFRSGTLSVEGAPFFFKLKKPHYAVAGFGIYARNSILPAWLAWDSFGIANGAPTFRDMMGRIESLRRSGGADPHGRNEIGCLMISAPVFFERDDWIRQPADWSKNIVQGKRIDLTRGEGRRVCLCRNAEPIETGRSRDQVGTKFRNPVLNPLIEAGRVEMTIPEKPRGSKQKYRMRTALDIVAD